MYIFYLTRNSYLFNWGRNIKFVELFVLILTARVITFDSLEPFAKLFKPSLLLMALASKIGLDESSV